MIVLYGIPMSRASRCLWMLEELGLEYENVPVHFLGEAQKPDFLKINPNGKVPALKDDGLVLFESLAINLHLAAKYGKAPFWPASQDDRSRTIQWSLWAMTSVEPPLMQVAANRAFLPEDQRDEEQAAQGELALRRPLGVLETALGECKHLLGPDFSAADLNVASVLMVAETFARIDLSPFAKVRSWLRACMARPSLGRALPGIRV
jgi:glutathione S-transferase